jgi:hypothetical protein
MNPKDLAAAAEAVLAKPREISRPPKATVEEVVEMARERFAKGKAKGKAAVKKTPKETIRRVPVAKHADGRRAARTRIHWNPRARSRQSRRPEISQSKKSGSLSQLLLETAWVGKMLSLNAGSTSDKLIARLDFSFPRSTANYVLDRRETMLHPQRSGLISNQGIRTIRFSLGDASNAFLCGETVRCAFHLRNDGAGTVSPICATPASLFDRMHILMGGVEVDDITYHSRFAQQEDLFLSTEHRLNNLGETWCATSDSNVAHVVASSRSAQ